MQGKAFRNRIESLGQIEAISAQGANGLFSKIIDKQKAQQEVLLMPGDMNRPQRIFIPVQNNEPYEKI